MLPDETQYHQLQQQQLLLTTHTPARAAYAHVDIEQSAPTTLDSFRPPTARRAEITRTVKAALDEPLTGDTVAKSWWSVYFITAVAVAVAVLLVLVMWWMFW